jgi:hypothetical protein
MLASQRSSACFPFQTARMMMVLHVFVFLLLVCLLLSLARFGRLDWLHLPPSSSKGGAKGSTLHRLLKLRSPLDCPACCHSSPASTGASPSPLEVAALERGQKPAVLPLSVVDNSDCSPTRLTGQETRLILASTGASCSPCQATRIVMSLHVFGFLLVFFLMLGLARLGRLCWLPLQPSHSQAARRRPLVHRLLKPRTPLDCPACRLPCTHSSVAGSAPVPVRPWREMKSRRGAPKPIHTEGFACPNPQCPSFGITQAHIHALVGDGTHGRAEQIQQTFRGPACRTTFTSRRNTPLYHLKTPSQRVAMVLAALAEGLDASAAERIAGLPSGHDHQPFCRGQPVHARTFHERSFRTLWLPHLQLDELRTRLRSSKHVLWLWLAIDPTPKILPVLQLGPRTQYMAHLVLHSLRQILAADLAFRSSPVMA